MMLASSIGQILRPARKKTMLDCKNAGVILPKFRAIDIDFDDWVLAERIFKP